MAKGPDFKTLLGKELAWAGCLLWFVLARVKEVSEVDQGKISLWVSTKVTVEGTDRYGGNDR